MASADPSTRLAQLLTQARERADAGDLSHAFEILKEASQLDPQNRQIEDAWKDLRSREQNGEFVLHLRAFLQSGDDKVGQRAIDALKQRGVPPNESVGALDMLLNSRKPLELIDALTGLLLASSADAGKALASRFADNPTALFRQIYDKGDDTFRAFARIPFNDVWWESTKVQKNAQIDMFRLSAAKLMSADVTQPERCMRYMARQLAAAPENVGSVIDEEVFGVILSNLDIRLDVGLRSQATLAASKILEIKQNDGEHMFARFLQEKVSGQAYDDLIIVFSAASAVFPIIPAVAARLFLTDGFVEQLVPNLEKNTEAAAAGQRKSRTLEKAALELLSAACVDKTCREAISRHCAPWLRDLVEESNGTHTGLAALILAKINAAAEDDITFKLANLVLAGNSDPDQAVEGLAYTSLRPKIKEEIVANKELLTRLVTAAQQRPSAVFGCLTIFSNLTIYRTVQSEEQKKMHQLKAYANQSKPVPDDPLDDDAHVTARASKMLAAKVVPALVACCKTITSPTNVALVVLILLSLSREPKHRAQMTQEGAVRLLLQIRDRMASTDKSSGEAATIERHAAHALARLLISVNPAHVFSAALPATSAVGALLPLLSPQSNADQPRDLLPTFESLLALTNLASLAGGSAGGGDAVRELALRAPGWDAIEDLLLAAHTRVQRAAVELVCNLMAAPAGVARFADGSPAARRRLHVLLALADAADVATRRAAGGALAMLTEWDAAVAAVLDRPNGLDVLVALCADEEGGDEALRHRGFACMLNLVNAPEALGPRAIAMVKEDGRADKLREALRRTKNTEILSLGVEVLKKLA